MNPGEPAGAHALVVIPCLDEERHIGAVIASVQQDPAAGRFLIVVADGGSTDRSREIVTELAAKSSNVCLVANDRRIQSAGVNLAARRFGAGARWLVRVDAHAEYPRGFVSRLIAEAERTGAASVVVSMRARGGNCFQRAAATAQNSVLGTGGSAHRRDGREGFVDHGHHALIEMDRFQALGGYNEAQSHNEDAEFDLRLARSGGRIWLTRAVHIDYFPRSCAGDLYRQYRNYGRGRVATLLRHHARPRLRQLLPAAVGPSALLAASAPWFPPAALPLLLWLGFCIVFGIVLGLRERTRCALASGCAAPIIHLAWSIGFWRGLLETSAASVPPLRRTARAGMR